jgi:sigma-B regulation protein RsbU (phosphoserine phosphatase)
MGVMETLAPYKSEITKLEPNDLIVLFTDGITEAMDTEFNEFSDERLESLAITMNNLSADEALKNILSDVETFTEGTEQSDDITCIVIKVNEV